MSTDERPSVKLSVRTPGNMDIPMEFAANCNYKLELIFLSNQSSLVPYTMLVTNAVIPCNLQLYFIIYTCAI